MEQVKNTFEYYYKKNYDRVYRYIFGKISNVHTAEDMTQDVFILVYNRFDSFDPEKASFETWLFVIVKNKLKNYYRDRKVLVDIDDPEQYTEPSEEGFEDDIVEAEYLSRMREYIADALEELNEVQQKIVVESFFNNKSSKEIAFMTGQTDVNVRVQLSRAIKKMRSYFEKNNIEWEM